MSARMKAKSGGDVLDIGAFAALALTLAVICTDAFHLKICDR